MDLVYIGCTVAFFGTAWALLKLCERLGGSQ